MVNDRSCESAGGPTGGNVADAAQERKYGKYRRGKRRVVLCREGMLISFESRIAS
jgi:hypothetical protein